MRGERRGMRCCVGGCQLTDHLVCVPVLCVMFRPERKVALCQEELQVAEKGLRRNPKWSTAHTCTLCCF
jgi:hypothetical protein